MSFSPLIFTTAGRALLTKALAGATLNFTKLKMGDGAITTQPPASLADLISSKVVIPITQTNRTGTYFTVRGTFSNSGEAAGWWWREIGVFATDPDDGEILYAYQNAYTYAEYIEAAGSGIIEKIITVPCVVGDTATVTATINESLIYATQDDIEAAIATHSDDTDAHPDKADISHNHNGVYAVVAHTHSYTDVGAAAASHTHTNYSPTSHNHDTAYSAIGHTHSDYALANHTHSGYAAANHTHSYSDVGAAAASHTHSGYATLDANSKVTPLQAAAKTVSVSAAKTLSLSDAGTFQIVGSSSARTVTIPSGVFPTDTEFEVMRGGTGAVTVKAASGVTLNGVSGGSAVLSAQYETAVFKCIASNVWVTNGTVS